MKKRAKQLVRGKYEVRVIVSGKCLTPSCKRAAVFFCDKCMEAIAAFQKIEVKK